MPPAAVGRYLLFDALAAGGMSSVHLGRMLGAGGFGRTVAIKRLHPQFAGDADFVSMMLDEARIVSRIQHPNVVPTLDVVHTKTDLFLVLEYVPGETLATIHRLLADDGSPMPLPVARAIGSGILLGLDAAHEAKDEEGRPLGIVHRDVSPQNVIVGTDGIVRVLDFGIAKAVNSSHQSEVGAVKGKVAYMAPEQLRSSAGARPIDRTADVYGASVVLWEVLTGRRMFESAEKSQIPFLVTTGAIRSARSIDERVPEDIDDILLRGLELDPERRFATAAEMATAIERTGPVATPREVAEWLGRIAQSSLAERVALVSRVERDSAERPDLRELATSLAAATTGDAVTVVDLAPPGSLREDRAAARPGRRWRLAAGATALVVVGAIAGVGWRVSGARPSYAAAAAAMAPPLKASGNGDVPPDPGSAPSPAPGASSSANASAAESPPLSLSLSSSSSSSPSRPPTVRRTRPTARPGAPPPPPTNSHGLFERN